MYYIYMVRCADDSLYTGIAADVCRRMREHTQKAAVAAKYTRTRTVTALEGLWRAKDRSHASKLEYAIKQLPRQKKLDLLANPALLPQFLPQLAEEAYEYISGVTLEACVEGTWNDETVCSAP